MDVFDDRSREAMRFERELEASVGLLFPNWLPCRYRGKCCPLDVQERREAGLLMGYCSNNSSIEYCLMYQILEL